MEIRSNGTTIEYAEQVKMDRPDGSFISIDCNILASLEQLVIQLLSFCVTAHQLEKEKNTCNLR
jgi:mediator of RNA polymerase II transcription subunit 14